MPTRDDLDDLLLSVELATGGNWRLDGEIARAFHDDPPHTPEYTGSLDAAVALVQEQLPGWQWTVEGGGMRVHACLHEPPKHDGEAWRGQRGVFGATPALALLAAVLRALTAGEPA